MRMESLHAYKDYIWRELLLGEDVIGWILGELDIGESDVLIDNLIGADVGGGWEEGFAGGGGEVVLIDAIAGDAESADQDAVSVERHGSGEEHDAVLILRIRGV